MEFAREDYAGEGREGDVGSEGGSGRSRRAPSEPIQTLTLDDEHRQSNVGLRLVLFALVQEDGFARFDLLIDTVRPAHFS